MVSEADEVAADSTVKKNLEVLRAFAARPPEGKERRLHLRFLVSPTEILDDGNGHVAGLKIERNRLDEKGNAVGTGEYEVLPVQMVLRSVGYRGMKIAGVPFDEARGVIPNEAGRVTGRVGEYTAGWIKRGPSGVIGTNKADAVESVKLLLEDARNGTLQPVQDSNRERIDTLLSSKAIEVVTLADWRALDAHELMTGQAQGRPRAKVSHKAQMLEVIRGKRG